MKKKGTLYILKLICLLQKHGKKNGYVVHIKTSMFTTEIQKKRCVAHIKTSMFTTEIRKKTGMLYILKLVFLLLKYKKFRYVVKNKTSMFSTEKTAMMLYIRNHKISELSVELIATCQSKLHLDVISLVRAAKVFVRNCPGLASRRGPFRGTG